MSKEKKIILVLVILLLHPALPAIVQARKVTSDLKMKRFLVAQDCLRCHGEEIKVEKYADSVHGNNACTSCHTDIVDIQKHAQGVYTPQPVNCDSCHEKEAREYKGSIHQTEEHFSCAECHANIHYLAPWDGSKIQIISKCTSCHAEKSYVTSGHARAVMNGNNDSAVCSDCHGLHDIKILHTAGRQYMEEAREFYIRACDKCHADKALMKKNNLTTIAVQTYKQSIHGKVQKLGYPAAGCADCHTSHNILPKDDPHSTINPKNLVRVCSRCHKGVNNNFIKFIAHPDFRDHREYPQLFWTMVCMVVLLLVVLIFFWGHTLLWWRKAYWERHRLLAAGYLIADKLCRTDNPGETYLRFKLRDRILHLTGLFSFFGLAATGLPLKFADAPWAIFMLSFIGGIHTALLIHRICALTISGAFLVVLGYGIHFTFFNKKAGRNWKERLFGPRSLMFSKKDWEDFVCMAIWFVDKGPYPRFGRWTYWEKFDFMAVFWGMAAIGLTGIVMWWPYITTLILPGWIINIARVVHSEEALLAISFIFTIHFFNTHFVPNKWPMNYAIFTGRIYKWELCNDRPVEFERLRITKELPKLKTRFPNIPTSLLSGLVGLSALIVGLLMVILIIWAYLA
jgi:cytochrome b subunit of formate dehydrogenase